MKKFLVIFLVVILAIIGYSALQRSFQANMFPSGDAIELGPVGEVISPRVGEQANNFRLQDYDGNIKELRDYSGKIVVLNFWATWCPFCIDEMPDFQEVYDEFASKGVEIVAVNRGESLETAKKFTDPLNLTYQLLLNSSDDVARSYNIFGMPSTYFINQEGELVFIKQGPMDADELKGRLYELFNLGEEKTVVETGIQALEAKTPPENTMQSSRTISVTEGVKHSIPLEDIQSGGPAKDAIPSIDNPQFVSVAEANEFLNDEGLGIAVSFNGVDRFYANQILVWHEIVNDTIGSQPALITYCPLCGTGIVFNPMVKDQPTEFGTSGKLWNSNLIMYDRQTDTYWSQVLGEAVVGELTGTKLALLPYENISYADWKTAHPNGEVLSTDTGERRNYNRSPYGNYDTNQEVFFPVDHTDDRYHPKEPTYQIELNGVQKIYPQEELDKTSGSFVDTIAGEKVQIDYDLIDKTIQFTKVSDNTEIVPFYGFWFSVIAVHPNAEVFNK